MITIQEIAFWNIKEAFIEKRLKDGVNVVFSNENNRWKTLLMQSLMYSLGYESIFPSGFDSWNCYFYSKIDVNGEIYEFLRRKNSVNILNNGDLRICNSISELKHFINSSIFEIPKIYKDWQVRIADLSLYYELFFLGQDKRNTSNLISKGANTKEDFLNMVYAMKGVSMLEKKETDIKSLKQEKERLETLIKAEKKKLPIAKIPGIAKSVSIAFDNADFQETSRRLTKINQAITELKKERNREENRKVRLEQLKIELSSLNRNLNEGMVRCSECGSKKIIFSNDDFEFDVSNDYVRQSILSAIDDKISLKNDLVEECTRNINIEQERLQKLLENMPNDTKHFILFQEEILDSRAIDIQIASAQRELDEIKAQIDAVSLSKEWWKEKQKKIYEEILLRMAGYYKQIDPEGVLRFENIFTKADETYSWSESQEYYFCKLVVLSEVTDHKFPIIIDSFRDGEISSGKEYEMLDILKKLNRQIILTSTLKKEEYRSDKYSQDANINAIDYSTFQDSRILQPSYVPELVGITNKFRISLS